MTETVQAPTAPIQYIPLAQLHESKTNPRKTWGKLDELVENVRKVGILQPLLARTNGGKTLELVFGHRRFRAAKAAGLESVPVMIRTMTDLEVLEAQVIENLHREDVHCLEEAEGYERLHETHGCSVDDIAAKVGKSRAYVYARMKLLALSKDARKAFYEGKLSASTALYVARIPDAKLQMEAIKQIGPTQYRPDSLSAREAFRIIESHYMLKLADAPFDRADDELVPKAGACKDCPKRTGNQKELFADVKSGDVCTDPVCYRSKVDAAWQKKKATAIESGQKVLEGKAAKELFPYGDTLNSSDYVTLDSRCTADPKNRTFRQVLGKQMPAPVLVRTPGGAIAELLTRSSAAAAAKKVLGKKAIKAATNYPGRSAHSKAVNEKWKAKKALDDLVESLTVTRILESAERSHVAHGDDAFLRFVAHAMLLDHYEGDRICERRKIALAKGDHPDQKLIAMLEHTGGAVLRGLVIELAISMGQNYGPDHTKIVEEACTLYNLDAKELLAEAKKKAKTTPTAEVVIVPDADDEGT